MSLALVTRFALANGPSTHVMQTEAWHALYLGAWPWNCQREAQSSLPEEGQPHGTHLHSMFTAPSSAEKKSLSTVTTKIPGLRSPAHAGTVAKWMGSKDWQGLSHISQPGTLVWPGPSKTQGLRVWNQRKSRGCYGGKIPLQVSIMATVVPLIMTVWSRTDHIYDSGPTGL